MNPRWLTRLDEKVGGRCYLSRNAYLRRWLEATGRSKGNVAPDILYLQIGSIGGVPDIGQRVTVVQSVTFVSEEMAERSEQCNRELAVTKKWCAQADLVVANSKMHAGGLIRIGVPVDRVTVVRPASGMPAPFALKREEHDQPVVGHAGQSIWWKRQDLARDAAVVVGAKFVCTNSTPHSRMPDWYRLLDLLLLPSVGDSWGLAVSEAISCGVPAVVTEGAGVAEEVRETGAGIVSPNDPMEFKKAVARALNPETLKAIKEKAIVAPTRTMSAWALDLAAAVEVVV